MAGQSHQQPGLHPPDSTRKASNARGSSAMARKELLPLIAELRRWRHAHGLRQYEASRVLREAGIPVTTDSLQAWEIGRWNPRAPVALALAEFLQSQLKRKPRRRP